MPRPPIEPPRPVAELAALPVHVLVRDYPEALAVLRNAGVDVPHAGGGSLVATGDDPGPLLDAIAAAIAWRAGS